MVDPLLDRTVREHYRHEADEDSRIRRGLGELELVRVREIVRRHLPAVAARWDDPGDCDVILEAARWIASEPGLIGLSPHHVVVASPS
jgi:hypothetical protein